MRSVLRASLRAGGRDLQGALGTEDWGLAEKAKIRSSLGPQHLVGLGLWQGKDVFRSPSRDKIAEWGCGLGRVQTSEAERTEESRTSSQNPQLPCQEERDDSPGVAVLGLLFPTDDTGGLSCLGHPMTCWVLVGSHIFPQASIYHPDLDRAGADVLRALPV